MKTEYYEYETDQIWASRLVDCMNRMGELDTNAVLLSLNGARKVKSYQRYPDVPYSFGNQQWRAFYHCHESPEDLNDEHGHYHFFTRQKQGTEWSHVIAMGMNQLGQPTRLFTTNLWVTGGKWFAVRHLVPQLNILSACRDNDLATDWLKYVLLLFQSEISDLLVARDNEVDRLFPNHYEQCYLDRSIYYLSSMKVNLKQQLLEVLGLEQV